MNCSHCDKKTKIYITCIGCNYTMCQDCIKTQDHICCRYMYDNQMYGYDHADRVTTVLAIGLFVVVFILTAALAHLGIL